MTVIFMSFRRKHKFGHAGQIEVLGKARWTQKKGQGKGGGNAKIYDVS